MACLAPLPDNMTRRQAIAEARAEADSVIELLTRRAKGWDRGLYRDDDTLRMWTIESSINQSVRHAFRLSAAFA